ncbi:response regulator transcription factor [Streptomyces sp. NPDC046261]|uniref:response regulator transcription factor n=1 Tax=Streptomyces sp. NPDC046261 TaxID=3157200 RepID=UPI0033D4571D
MTAARGNTDGQGSDGSPARIRSARGSPHSVCDHGAIARVFLIDDHPMFRAGVRLALEREDDMEVVGEAATGEEALEEIRGHPRAVPDVILMNIPSTGIQENDFIRTARGLAGPTTRILIVSMEEATADEVVVAAMSAGALGFISKAAPCEQLLEAVRIVMSGGAVFCPAIAARLEGYFSAVGSLPGQVVFPQLTVREREILDLLARGYDNRGIARRLVVSEKTVRNHVSHIFAKLQVSDRTTAALRARNAGMGC